MRIKDVIRAPKSDVQFGGWNTDRMPKTVFPLAKSGKNSVRLGAAFHWGLITFSALGRDFRVVVGVDHAKQQYYAYLGQIHGSDTRMLASYEFHSSHGGWHVHAGCGDISAIPVGRYMGPWKRNIPKDWKTCCQMDFGIKSDDDALDKACSQFRIKLAGFQPGLKLS
jgi:hypothetical protein